MDYAVGDNSYDRQAGIARGIGGVLQRDPNKQDAYSDYMKGQQPNGFGGYGESLARASEALGMSAEMITKLASGRKDIMPNTQMQPAAEVQVYAPGATIQGARFPVLSPAEEMAMEAQRRRQAGM